MVVQLCSAPSCRPHIPRLQAGAESEQERGREHERPHRPQGLQPRTADLPLRLCVAGRRSGLEIHSGFNPSAAYPLWPLLVSANTTHSHLVRENIVLPKSATCRFAGLQIIFLRPFPPNLPSCFPSSSSFYPFLNPSPSSLSSSFLLFFFCKLLFCQRSLPLQGCAAVH